MDNKNLVVDRRTAKIHKRKLNTLLDAFYNFLLQKPKPSDESVRSEFLQRETEWKIYCFQNNLDIRTSMLFNAKVSYEWERRTIKEKNIKIRN